MISSLSFLPEYLSFLFVIRGIVEKMVKRYFRDCSEIESDLKKYRDQTLLTHDDREGHAFIKFLQQG